MRRLRKVSRRSFLTTVAGSAAAGSFLLVTGRSHAAQPQGSCSDSDDGENADPAGQGRNCTPGTETGCSDSDTGQNADPGGEGRNCTPGSQTGCSDSDQGQGADPGGQGRNCSPGSNGTNNGVCSDSDPGDPVGQGRSCAPGQRRGGNNSGAGCSDRDSGRGADPAGQGRTCAPQGSRRQPQGSGCSDNDPAQGGDRSGQGRHCTPGANTVSLQVEGLPCAASGCPAYRPPVTGSYCARPGCGFHINRHGVPRGRSADV